MDKIIEKDFYYNFTNYKVIITYKRVNNINYRFDKEKGIFKISAPRIASQKRIFKYLEKFAPSLLKRSSDIKPGMNNEFIYIFGNKYNLTVGEKDKLDETTLTYKNQKSLNKLLKKMLLNYIKKRIVYYYEIMDINEYRISIKNMKTRLGSNSKETRRLAFTTTLVHYKQEVIDSVIVHELAHDKYYDHSKYFHYYVESIFPNYKACRKALNHTNYEYGNNNQ